MMSRLVVYGVLWLSINLSVFSPAFASEQDTLHIAVASNFKKTHDALVAEFTLRSTAINGTTPRVISSSGSSGTLFAQIAKGAPYDVFLSADAMRPDELIGMGLASKASRIIYAQGRIVLWQPDSEEAIDIGFFREYSGRWVMANPALAPYGAASRSMMQRAGFWKTKDRSRIVANNIAAAFQYLASGTVKIGWVAFSQLKSWEKRSNRIQKSYWLPPIQDYPPINQVVVGLSHATNKFLAREYLVFLQGAKAREIIESFGYLVPEKG